MREVVNATAVMPESSTNSCSISTDSTAMANKNDPVNNLNTCTHYNNNNDNNNNDNNNNDNNNLSSTNTYNGKTVERDNIPDYCDRDNNRDARIIFQDCDGSNIGYNKTNDQLNLDSMNLSHQPTNHHNHSPIVSIRSLDSSIIESDSDVDLTYDDADMEEVNHNSCIITELNSEMTYPPNHPKIPKINNGLTLINQEINPDSGNVSSAGICPLNKLSIIGDELGKAQSLGTMPSAVATTKIGSVAVSNSTDITFGDKHFYEGPVTIQQFLIDNRNKLKQQEEEDKTNNMSQQEHENRNGIADRQDNIEGGNVLRIVPRDAWLAQTPVNTLVALDVPVRRVIIVPTYTSDCDAQSKCTYRVRMIQTFNIESQQNDDIVYNFLIGGDGNIYEGRGWLSKAAAVKGYNDDSITVAFIGTFHDPPASKVLNIAKLFLTKALRSKKLTADYKIVGANQLDESFALGTGLYKSFENWPHWSQK
ncbi:peptidoglycan recognition protein LC isoform 4-T10 [Glossina fuscipes fuscipes]